MDIIRFLLREKQNLYNMNRRTFNQLTGTTGLGLFSGISAFASAKNEFQPHEFNLPYAPHLGMFKHHAGDDPIDQLNFMADQGFTAFEDNDMRNRDVTLQEKWHKPWKKEDCGWAYLWLIKSIGKNPI